MGTSCQMECELLQWNTSLWWNRLKVITSGELYGAKQVKLTVSKSCNIFVMCAPVGMCRRLNWRTCRWHSSCRYGIKIQQGPRKSCRQKLYVLWTLEQFSLYRTSTHITVCFLFTTSDGTRIETCTKGSQLH